MSAARTFPGSLFHVPSPRRGILRPVLRTAKSFMPLSCTLTTKAENINQVFFCVFFLTAVIQVRNILDVTCIYREPRLKMQ